LKKALVSLVFLLLMHISKSQTADFSISQTSSCSPLRTTLTDISSGGTVVSREWDMDDNGRIIYDSVSVYYSYWDPRTYTITLKVTFQDGTVRSRSKTVVVHPDPVANFSMSDSIGCPVLTVRFTDLSTTATGSITSWEWDLDVGWSVAQNPTQSFSDIGTYLIKFSVLNNWGCQSNLAESIVNVYQRPTVSFDVNPKNSCNDTLTIFSTNTSTNAPNYLWNFGDGGTSTAFNPSHFYSSPGTYTITLRSTISPSCQDVAQRIVNIGGATAMINIFPDTVCEGAPANFSGIALPAGALGRWVFQAPSRQVPGLTATHTFNSPGQYEVLFIASRSWGCPDTVRRSIFVKPAPKPNFTVDTARSCKIPFTVTFTNLTNPRTNLKFTWNFGDALPLSNDTDPAHTYNSFGTFDVTLTATDTSLNGCTGSITKNDTIRIIRPVVNLVAFRDKPCGLPVTVSFTASTSNFLNPSIQYIWQFGDNTADTTTLPTTSHVYNAIGNYVATVTATSANGCSDAAITSFRLDTCVIVPPPRRDTVIIVTRSCDPCNRFTFRDTVSNSVIESWNMGDNTIYNTNPPAVITHNYPVGIAEYTVTVTRKNISTGIITTSTIKVKVICIDPDFVVDKNVICPGKPILFTPVGIDSSVVLQYRWEFGNRTEVINNPAQPPYVNGQISHTYNAIGIYHPRLIIRDRYGCDRYSDTTTIIVEGPRALFSSMPRTTCDSTILTFFKDSSLLNHGVPIAEWEWTFGDNSPKYITTQDTIIPKEYTGTNVPITTFDVTLRITDSAGCSSTFTRPRQIALYRPRARFSTNDTLQCGVYRVFFSNNSSAVNAVYTWYFGDGLSQNSFNATHNYSTDGQYDVKLVARDENGCLDSMIRNNYIKFIKPVAGMRIPDTATLCWPQQVRFFDSSQYARSYYWDFGDGSLPSREKNPANTYPGPGLYLVTLIVTGPDGCRDTLKQNLRIRGAKSDIFIDPPISGCKPFTILSRAKNQLNVANYLWDFNDGSLQQESPVDSVKPHTYSAAGKYLPKLIYTSSEGCRYGKQAKDSIIVDSAMARFLISANNICQGGTVSFTNTSMVPRFSSIVKYEWNFGNGTTSSLAAPTSVRFDSAGIFTVTLIIYSRYGCVDTFTMPQAVKVFRKPEVRIKGPLETCQFTTQTFRSDIVSEDSIISKKWFINGVFRSDADSIILQPTIPGDIEISLQVDTKYGCDVITLQKLTVRPVPVPAAAPDTVVCKGSTFRLRAFDGVGYSWTPSGTLTGSNTSTPLAQPLVGSTTYNVTVTNVFGCIAKDSIVVQTDDSVYVEKAPDQEICAGDSVVLFATSNANAFLWSPAAGLSSATILRPMASPSQTTNYRLIAFSRNTCPNDTAYTLVLVNARPIVRASANPAKTYPGDAVQLISIASAGVVSYQWTPSNRVESANSPMAAWKADTTTTFKITVRDAKGCTSYALVDVEVFCTDSFFRVPNAFHPDGNQKNEFFRPLKVRDTKGDPKLTAFAIYNRWGQLMYKVTGAHVSQIRGWDGRINGVLQPSGTYVWVAEFECGKRFKKGYAILIK
jgi:gliding motility-associated-like protein